MNDAPPVMISKDYDEFNEKTTTRHISEVSHTIGYYETCSFGLRHVKTSNLDSLLLDCTIKKEDWFFMEKITFNCDQDNIHEDYTQTDSDTAIQDHIIGDDSTVYTYEYGYFNLDRAIIEKICEANVLKVRVTGQSSYSNFNEGENSLFQIYCRQWYNQFYDSSKYVDSLEVKTGGGCFIATAAMGNYNHPKVVGLRNFRDQYLEESALGRKVIEKYYKYGPKPAGFIEQSNLLKKATYYTLVEPAYIVSQFLLRNK